MANLTNEQKADYVNAALSRKGSQSQVDQAAVDNMQVSFDDVDKLGDRAALKEAISDISKYQKMLSQKITLINESLTAAIPFARENLYLFCAYTGSGKSTVAANISYPLWKEGKKVLVISNEESKQDVLLRIAFLELGFNFNDYKKGYMSNQNILKAIALFEDISTCVKVIDVTYKNGLTTKVEGVMSALEAVKTSDYSCVLIDYFQLIKYSVADKNKKSYEVLNDLRIALGLYIKNSNVPIVMFIQLYSQSKRAAKGHDIDTRIKDCSAIVEPATVIIEVIPDFENKVSSFIIVKDRFGMAGKRIECPFENGRYLKQLDERGSAERKLDQLQEKLNVPV